MIRGAKQERLWSIRERKFKEWSPLFWRVPREQGVQREGGRERGRLSRDTRDNKRLVYERGK